MKQEKIERLLLVIKKTKERLDELHEETRSLNDSIYVLYRTMEELEKFINENKE